MNNNINKDYIHYPVFHQEVIDYIEPVVNKGSSTVVDCTLGEGGHTEMLLKTFPNIKMICFERDSKIMKRAEKRLEEFQDRVTIINDNFSNFDFYFKGSDPKFSAILYDFGISSFHFDADKRGFTFREDQPLDMRLDKSSEYSAYDIVNNFDEKDIADIIYKYGEDRQSRRIASFIVKAREEEPIKTSLQLSDIVLKSIPPRFRPKNIHPATRVFQALRIYINSELDSIETSLKSSYKYVAKEGRILAISFHSLEDRLSKNIFRSLSKGCFCTGDEIICNCDRIPKVKLLTKKPILPGEQELTENNRSRSAKLRVVEKI